MPIKDLSQLPIRPYTPLEKLDVDAVIRQPHFGAVIEHAVRLAGLEHKQVYGHPDIRIQSGNWSDILSGRRHFPLDKLKAFNDIVGHQATVVWIAHRNNVDPYGLRTLRTEHERQLAEKDAELQRLKLELEITRGIALRSG